MATQFQLRRGSTAEHATFTGAIGEVTVDTDKDVAVIHDGTTVGGRPLLRENGSQNLVTTGTITGASLTPSSNTAPTNGMYLPAANSVGIATDGTERFRINSTGAATFSSAVTIQGDLTINGTTTTIDTQNLLVEDKNIVIGQVATPSDSTADSGGITLKGATDKTIQWLDSTDSWTLSEHVDIASGKEYRINGTKVLDATSLGSSVLITSTNITDGTIVNGDINASAAIAGTKISPDFGSQNIATTGTVTGASLIPSSSTVPANGVYLPAANTVGIASNSSGRVFINSSGQVGVGLSSPTEALHVSGNILATGNVTAFSDIRVKDNIESVTNSLEAVLQLRAVTYTRKGQETEGRQLGLIAQEVEPIVPEVVKTHEDGMKSLAYSNLVALLIEAIKEQQSQIDELRAFIKEN